MNILGKWIVTGIVALLFMSVVASQNVFAQAKSPHFKVLIFSKTEGFRHDVIPQGIVEIAKIGMENGFDVDATEDANLFTDENLQQYAVIIFHNTTGNIFNEEQKAVFQRFIRQGKGWVGIHAATDTEYDWEWYAGLISGAHFLSHPKQQKATVLVEDFNHPATNHLPYNWELWDEWYNFRKNPREKVRVLATLDEKSYDPGEGAMGDHPIVWCTIYDGGRIFYTGLGHRVDVFKNPLFQRHLLGGIRWAAGIED